MRDEHPVLNDTFNLTISKDVQNPKVFFQLTFVLPETTALSTFTGSCSSVWHIPNDHSAQRWWAQQWPNTWWSVKELISSTGFAKEHLQVKKEKKTCKTAIYKWTNYYKERKRGNTWIWQGFELQIQERQIAAFSQTAGTHTHTQTQIWMYVWLNYSPCNIHFFAVGVKRSKGD